MKRLITLLGVSALAAATAMAQSATTTNQTTTTVQSDGTVKTVQYTGEVVRYEPGKTIVLRQGTSPAVTYTLAPALTVPAEVQVGRRVTVYTAPDTSGTTIVTRVITANAPAAAGGTPQTSVTTTKETTTQPSGDSTTTTKTTTVTGEVVRIEPGRSILLKGPDSKVITYILAPDLSIPAEIQTGRRVIISTEPNDAGAVLVTQVTTVAPEGTSVTRETVSSPDGSQTMTTTRSSTTVTGEVVRYEAGQTIVIRQPDSQVVTYTLSPSLQAPAEVTIGRRVVITTQPSTSGPVVVTRITTEQAPGAAALETVTEKTVESGAGDAQTTIYGTISAYAPGKTITIVHPNKTTVTYVVDTQSELPADLAVGKSVTVRTTTVAGSPVVRKVTYRTTTQTTKQKTVS